MATNYPLWVAQVGHIFEASSPMFLKIRQEKIYSLGRAALIVAVRMKQAEDARTTVAPVAVSR